MSQSGLADKTKSMKELLDESKKRNPGKCLRLSAASMGSNPISTLFGVSEFLPVLFIT